MRGVLACAVLLAAVAACDRTSNGPRVAPDPSVKPAPSAIESRNDATPEAAWRSLLNAMRTRDERGVERLTTKAGLASLEAGVRDEKRADVFERWGKGWSKWEIRWRARTDHRAEAWLGPEVKEHGLVFVENGDGWKLERWTPGE